MAPTSAGMNGGPGGEARQMLHRLSFVSASMLFCLLLIGCSVSTAPKDANRPHDTLRIAVQQDVKTLNPLLISSTVDAFVQRFMFEPLLSADPRGNLVPMLAEAVPSRENHGISRDGLSITYHLRKNAHWTDGVPVSSRDVKFSWRAIMNPANNALSRHGYDDIAGIDTPDAHTAVVRLKKAFAPFVDTFFAESDLPYSVVPEHVLARFPNINQIAFNARPTVSDGPFRFERWAHGDRIVVTANDTFFMGKPHLRRIEIRVVPDENTAVNLLRTHDVDFMYQASIATYQTLKSIPGVHFVWVDVNGYEGLEFNTAHRPLNDVRVRRAIAYGINKAQLVRTLTSGQEKLASEDLPDWMWASDSGLTPYPYDPEKARKLLKAAGVTIPLELTIVTENANVTHKREALEIQAMLAQIGINVQLKTYPGDLLYAAAAAGGILNAGNFDLAIWPWYGGIDPDNLLQFGCISVPPHGYNESRYCNPEMERLQNRALTNDDRAQRTAAYHGIEALLKRDNPTIALWWQRQQEALVVDLKHFTPNPVVESWNSWEWSL
ncbi:MAG: peptide ABC transporter substrate-binding protein [Candidatus Eremiobacteraeota bacterium]|nr:peptide ABC transporter substrate-binding protein [Candidatus Eremiobacteraeota bacterium]